MRALQISSALVGLAIVAVCGCSEPEQTAAPKTMPEGAIHHPVLGTLVPSENRRAWYSDSHVMGAFGYSSKFEIYTDGSPPSEAQLKLALEMTQATQEFREEVAGHMRESYDSIRHHYVETIGDPRFKNNLTLEDLPELKEDEDIWKVIKGLGMVFIDENLDFTLSFQPTFDPNNDFDVSFEDGEFFEAIVHG